MENQATTFKTEHYEWTLTNGGVVATGRGAVRTWRATNEGNGLQVKYGAEWHIEQGFLEPFDTECKLALRALVGPPQWETRAKVDEAVSGIAEMIRQDNNPVNETPASRNPEQDSPPCEHVAMLQRHADQAKADLDHLAGIVQRAHRHLNHATEAEGNIEYRCEFAASEIIRLRQQGTDMTRDRDEAIDNFKKLSGVFSMANVERDRIAGERDLAVRERDDLRADWNALESLVKAHKEAGGADHILGAEHLQGILERAIVIDAAYWELVNVTRERPPSPSALSIFFLAIDGESEVASVLACPHGEPMHFHHDGCPCCMEHEAAGVSDEACQTLREDNEAPAKFTFDAADMGPIVDPLDAIRERLDAHDRRLDGMDLALKHHVEWVSGHLKGLAEQISGGGQPVHERWTHQGGKWVAKPSGEHTDPPMEALPAVFNAVRRQRDRLRTENDSLRSRFAGNEARVIELTDECEAHVKSFKFAAADNDRLAAELTNIKEVFAQFQRDAAAERGHISAALTRANEVRRSAEEQNAKLIAENQRLRAEVEDALHGLATREDEVVAADEMAAQPGESRSYIECLKDIRGKRLARGVR